MARSKKNNKNSKNSHQKNTKNSQKKDDFSLNSSNKKGKSHHRKLQFSSQELEDDLEMILEEEEIDHVEPVPPPPATTSVQPLIQITKDDVARQIQFWPSSIFCYVLVRFKTKEQQQFVLNNGHLLFDNKPVIVKEWIQDTELIKHDVKRIPIWMKLYGLDVKYWGLECLKKLSGVVGGFIKCDDATVHRNFLGFARIMIEVDIGQEFPIVITFLNEYGVSKQLKVVYDWLPLQCTACKGLGHPTENCRKGMTKPAVRKIWKPKVVPTQKQQKPAPKPVVDKIRRKNFWMIVVYGLNKAADRLPLWDSLRVYHSMTNGPWIVAGDFNSVMAVNERIGGAPISHAEIRPMLQTIQDCLIYLEEERQKKGSSFKYYNMWSLASTYNDILRSGWQQPVQGTPMFRVVQKLKGLKVGLKTLNKDHFADIENLTHVAELSLNHFQQLLVDDLLNEDLCHSERDCARNLDELLKARDQFLRQKAKGDWMQREDDNTAYFHASIKNRRANNRVYQVKDINNQLCSTPETIQKAFEDYYKIMLGSSKSVKPLNKRIVKYGNCLTPEHCSLLTAPVTREEVRLAMFSILGTKAPGPDGYSSQFFKDNWSVVGADVISAVQSAFQSGKVLSQCNATIITLIPKVPIPDNVMQFRPISCCNTLYKYLSKVICTRLEKLLPHIINPSQSAFVKGRDIVGNILICQDLVRLHKRKSCSPRILMKLDLQKAYDSVEWNFVEDMLRATGFPEQFTQLLVQCFTTPTFSLSVNGESFGYFRGKRGLRQGDPLSSLLFTLCLEYLNRILLVTQNHSKFKFHPLCNRIKLSYLCFADDLILFCKGERASVGLMLQAVKLFSKSSGLSMNCSKSSFYYNVIDAHLVTEIERAIGMKRGTVPFKYLGVNVSPKRLSVMDCNILVDKIVDRIRGLGSGKLFYVGRLVLIKAVLSSLHSYWSRIFILPKTVIGKLEAICRSFLWYGNDTKESPMLVSWETEETHEHLFFSCEFSQRCRGLVSNVCLLELPHSEVIQWWVHLRDYSACRKKIIAVILASLMYNIWNARNVSRVDGLVIRPECIPQRVKNQMKMRVGQLQIKSRNATALTLID
ncbi:uncharacterized protein LOC141587606 [Silene latifolia]|uniref:uncharacterized protein LOC141587606 n=1 Tax=Silene latifolia TaxID=37657 RepID=UPI003D77B652